MTRSSGSGACLRICLLLFAASSAIYFCAPPLISLIQNSLNISSNSRSCDSCNCDCPAPQSLLKIAPGLINLSFTDCGKHDPDLNSEMGKQFVDLLTEELKLQETVAEENSHHMNSTLLEAKRIASQYQKEAQKCISATETCEEARERSEAALIKERKLTSLWEKRARQMGYHALSWMGLGEGRMQSKLSLYGDLSYEMHVRLYLRRAVLFLQWRAFIGSASSPLRYHLGVIIITKTVVLIMR
ncbi:uncharacterized protein LOC18430985 isoform X2 [Amborella trichopoda]|uniref:uncharacterized protein LOC18430985 isoform X2 n=1 Tax=Amborella trichopoda TaxID=13333 RepID=UPI0005D32C2A|nr:uncharacterized protein LOC18430985 isoform X2 [Amborella trichopoda]|eukprot:XP_011622148.1 uncharacterized protein LOC18430985 isoform X2 [Amborella trichopoda]